MKGAWHDKRGRGADFSSLAGKILRGGKESLGMMAYVRMGRPPRGGINFSKSGLDMGWIFWSTPKKGGDFFSIFRRGSKGADFERNGARKPMKNPHVAAPAAIFR